MNLMLFPELLKTCEECKGSIDKGTRKKEIGQYIFHGSCWDSLRPGRKEHIKSLTLKVQG